VRNEDGIFYSLVEDNNENECEVEVRKPDQVRYYDLLT